MELDHSGFEMARLALEAAKQGPQFSFGGFVAGVRCLQLLEPLQAALSCLPGLFYIGVSKRVRPFDVSRHTGQSLGRVCIVANDFHHAAMVTPSFVSGETP